MVSTGSGRNKLSVLDSMCDGAATVLLVLGALVIGISWLLTWVYVRWANLTYDPELNELKK